MGASEVKFAETSILGAEDTGITTFLSRRLVWEVEETVPNTLVGAVAVSVVGIVPVVVFCTTGAAA